MNLVPIDTPLGDAKVICLSEVRNRYAIGKCQHLHITVDEDMAEVECGDCGAKLNPIAMLARFAREESRFKREREALIDARKKLEAKQRTKCQHCGQMTRVRPA